ncbi:MAG: LacI family DNA-binding transcriptional regulator [Pseudomonadota bacterium]
MSEMAVMRTTPTLEDVSKAAGVSTATVSRCLNTPDLVATATRERVAEAIAALGYTPNFAARVMAAKRTMTIGAIVPTLENAIFARGLQAFQEELNRSGYTLLVASSAYDPVVEADQIKTMVARGADGLLLIGHERDEAIYSYLDTQHVPTVVAWAYDAHRSEVSVGFDNRAAMRMVTEEVLHLGHERIGVISGMRAGNDRVRLRLEGVLEAVSAAGLDRHSVIIVEKPYGVESGAEGFDALMSQVPRPTAIICVNDVLATGAMLRAQGRSYDVPGDISITGFDDLDYARILTPALTTVHVPHRAMGEKAARQLVEMVENKSCGQSIKLDTELKRRGSLATVPVWYSDFN